MAEDEILSIKIAVASEAEVPFKSGLGGIDATVESVTDMGESLIFTLSIISTKLNLLFKYLTIFNAQKVRVFDGDELKLAALDFSRYELRAVTISEFKIAWEEVAGGDWYFYNAIVRSRKLTETAKIIFSKIEIQRIVNTRTPEELKELLEISGIGMQRFVELRQVLYHILNTQSI